MDYRKTFVVEPGTKVRLDKIDPVYKDTHELYEQAMPEIAKHVARMDRLQYLIYADGDQSLLVVLQALDAGGKDGVVRHLFSGMNPQGTTSVAFKQPSKVEAAHDFLWRAHQHVPGKGEVVIFNRSHYEDVLVVRVHELVPKQVWSKRYELINDFETMLVAERHAHPQVLPAHQRRGAARRASSSGSTIRRGNGRSASPTTLSASFGRTTSRPTRTPSRRPVRTTRRGTSSRRTTSGSAISLSRRSSRTPWRRWD